ncbi:MAG: Asp-tRNA(Asn)/Glu-tRNA(Gln) amidotransferase subunit GatC, partial [Thiobacillus sp.]|nr:Asp-tRNA(Asn)/Glu-tRNA(Gln) amidotransferase subunit GatC [Thiobacillus sp.]MDP3126474.1 Asp-tRNA(Asn)/Glu-tRNA(Gln) amidotransferase subunit GatC [Thiobacillus sp.]
MSLSTDDVKRIARLARIETSDAEAQATQTQLNNIFDLIATMQAIDTRGVAP